MKGGKKMNYQTRTFASASGLSSRSPDTQRELVILTGLDSDYNNIDLYSFVSEMEEQGIKKVVLDMSKIPTHESRVRGLAFFEGAFHVKGIEAKYTGMGDKPVFNPPSFGEYITPKLAKSIDSAVEDFTK
jgi:hypothetical protein